jgi:DNA polymerase
MSQGELRELAEQARAWVELDARMGLLATPVALARGAAPETVRPSLAAVPAPLPAAVAVPAPVAAPAVAASAVAAPADASLDARRAANAAKLDVLARSMQGCTKCRLCEGRMNLVFGQGDAAAELVFVGEGPGQTEDETGLAFVGRAGELLTKMIEAMGLGRSEVFIANVVKCRPPGNRVPAPDEMATCLPFLEQQLDIIKPRAICALGKTAAIGLGLIKPNEALGRVRGRFLEWRGTPVLTTFHPAYLLRNPAEKRTAWNDLQKLFPHLERRRPA